MTNNDKIPELSKGEFENFIKNGVVVVDFFAEWCMPCLMMAPVLDELNEKFSDKIKFGKINIDENSDLAQKFRVMSIPNFILFKDGKQTDQFIGALSLEDFEEKLRKHL